MSEASAAWEIVCDNTGRVFKTAKSEYAATNIAVKIDFGEHYPLHMLADEDAHTHSVRRATDG